MKYDAIIIGAGPAGVSCSIYLKRANLNILVIEKKAVGGQVMDAGLVENYPAFSKISGFELSQKFKEHLLANDIDLKIEEVIQVIKDKNYFLVKTKENEYQARSIVVSTGAKPRHLNCEGEEDLQGMGVSYCAYCDGSFYKDLDVAIVGGGNSACEASLYLKSIAKNVYLINKTDKLLCEEKTKEEIKKSKNIKIYNNTTIRKFIKNEDGLLSGADILEDKKPKSLKIDGAFVYIGHVPTNDFLDKKIKDENGYILADSLMKTCQDGIFAAGDCLKKDKKQIVTATSDGAIAAFSVMQYLKNK